MQPRRNALAMAPAGGLRPGTPLRGATARTTRLSASPGDSNLRAQAADAIRRMIVHKELRGGSVLVEQQLAAQLSISRTPMREALMQLAGEGLLVRGESRSYTVRRVTTAEFFQTMQVREVLELQAITLAAGNISRETVADLRRRSVAATRGPRNRQALWSLDDELHRLFAEASGNAVLATMIESARRTTRLFEISYPFQRATRDAAEHVAILDALVRSGAPAARRAMRAHLTHLQGDVMRILSGR